MVIDDGIIEVLAMPDGSLSRLKPPARGLLAAILGESLPDRPYTKAEILGLLYRARSQNPPDSDGGQP